MKGLYGYNNLIESWPIHSSQFSFNINTNSKFKEDKIFTKRGKYILGLDGVILNKSDLINSDANWAEFFIQNVNDLSDSLRQLKGSFHGFIYDTHSEELILFNDPTGSKNFYYYQSNDAFIFNPSDIDLIKFIKKQNLPLSMEEASIYAFLAYGFLPSSWSWITNCKRLDPGSILRFKNQKITKERYREFKSEPTENSNKKDLHEEFDFLFRRAVNLQYTKDCEYGYDSYATLSGGLDSRSTVLQAYELGFRDQTTFTCSQNGYADAIIAREISGDCKFNHLFYPLDDAEHLMNIPDKIERIGGSALFSGPAHVIQGIESNWEENYGLIHSGHIGDGIMGAFLSAKQPMKPNLNFGRISPSILPANEAFDNKIAEPYDNEEEFKLYERGFSGASAGVWGLEHLSYNISPFVDVDVMGFLLALPYEVKYKRKIYVEWLLKHHKNWTNYELESLASKPDKYWKFKYQTPYLRLRFGFRKLLSRKYRLLGNMAPEQYWYENNSKLLNYYKQEFDEGIQLARDYDIPFIYEINQLHNSKDYTDRAKSLHLAYLINLIYS